MRRLFVVGLVMLALSGQAVWAAGPATMSYQAVLKNSSGQIVPDGSYSLTFAIYTTGGSQLWTETHNNVATSGGVFSVILGSEGQPLNLAFDDPYELGISVNGGAELSPRIPLTAAPYSLNTRTISQINGNTVISNPARILENGGLTIEESGETGRTLTLKPPELSAGAGIAANSVNGLRISTVGAMTLATDDVNRLTITRDGGVGIGTSNVTGQISNAGLRLTGSRHVVVDNDFGLFSVHRSGSGFGAGIDTETNDGLSLHTDGWDGVNPDLHITPDGKVGLGTSNPVHALHITIPGHVAVKDDYGFFSVNGSGNLRAGIDDDGGNLDLWANGAARARVTNSGVSGISSIRWKTHIRPIGNALRLVQKLQGVRYTWKEDSREDIGLIAEEVGKVIPEVVVYEKNGVDAQGLRYGNLVAVLIEAVKEQNKEIDTHRAVVEKQSAMIEKQQAMLESLLQRVAAMEKDDNVARVQQTTGTEE